MGRNMIDITGQRFGHLTAIQPADSARGHNKPIMWECKCDCGNTTVCRSDHLRRGEIVSCGKCDIEKRLHRVTHKGDVGKRSLDISGKRFGKLIAICPTAERSGGSVVWKCMCDCGNTTEVSVSSLNSGVTRSCGCLAVEHTVQRNKYRKKLNEYIECDDYYMGISSNTGDRYLIDKDDYDNISQYTWRSDSGGYMKTTICTDHAKTQIFMHRMIMRARSGDMVDHKNGDTKDNRKINLRICTQQENARNRKPHKNSASGITGVRFDKLSGKYIARIHVDKDRAKRIGAFDTLQEAAEARKLAELEYFGEFAPILSRPDTPDTTEDPPNAG